MSTPLDLKRVREHFRQNDPTMARMFDYSLATEPPVRLPVPLPPTQYFARIIRSIVGQQISTGAAKSVYAKLEKELGTITPQSIAEADDVRLRECGLSRQKISYLKYNAEHWDEVSQHPFIDMEDEEVIFTLTKLHGVGKWTAEMFLIMSLGRPNVFSYGDFGLMYSLYKHYSLRAHWNRKITETVERWSPYKTYASFTLWHYKDTDLSLPNK